MEWDSEAPRTFLDLAEEDAEVADIVVLSLPYELTVSYGQGTAQGPAACIEASTQVELYDPLLDDELPAGKTIATVEPWNGEGGSLAEQLEGIERYCSKWMDGNRFPLVLGGEHGSLPAQLKALRNHPVLEGEISRLTLVQIDAHADLRQELDGDPNSHACAVRRSLDLGVGSVLQVGVRAYSKEESEVIEGDDRVTTWFARDLLSPCDGEKNWNSLLSVLSAIEGPVWLTIDVDGLDGRLVPHTGTPVPGGVEFWQVVEVIEALFASDSSEVLGADISEIVPGIEGPLTQFMAAMLATKIIAAHIASLR